MSKLLLTILLTGFCINAKAMSWGEQKSCEIKPIAFERDVCLKNFETRDTEITRLNSLHAAGKPDDRIKPEKRIYVYGSRHAGFYIVIAESREIADKKAKTWGWPFVEDRALDEEVVL